MYANLRPVIVKLMLGLSVILFIPAASYAVDAESGDQSYPGLHQAYTMIDCPEEPTRHNSHWRWYLCKMNIAGHPEMSPFGIDFPMSYMTPAPESFSKQRPARLMLYLHPSDRGSGRFVTGSSSFSLRGKRVEIHTQEERYQDNPGSSWWGFSGGQVGKVANYNGRRLVASIDYIRNRYGEKIDLEQGIHLKGKSLGGAGVMHQPLILPAYGDKIAIVESILGHMIIPACCVKTVSSAWGLDHFPFADIRERWHSVRNIHFYWRGGKNDNLGRFDMAFFELCEAKRISCSGYWLQGGHSHREAGYNMPTAMFTDPRQDVTLDRILPVITNSSANFHGDLRGHHNRGITWDHSALFESEEQIRISLQYNAMKNMGPGIPDQPVQATFSITPRHLQRFDIEKGGVVRWKFGSQSGTVEVDNTGLITIDGLLLEDGKGYTTLLILQDR